MKKNLITAEGYEEIRKLLIKLQEEKKYLVEEKRIAALQGDRSENAEYIAAKENIRNIDKQLFKLKNIIENATVVDTSKREKKDVVLFGSKVLISNGEEEFWIKIVGTKELVYTQKITDCLCISNISPLGRAIFGKEEGDEVLVKDIDYEIIKIS